MPGPLPMPGMPPMSAAQATKWRPRPAAKHTPPPRGRLAQFFFGS